MDKRAIWKWLFLGMAIVFSMAILLKKDQDGNLRIHVPLGIDIQGGSSFVVQIDETKIQENIAERMPDATAEEIQATLKSEVTKAQERAVQVIRGRIDGLGVREANIFTEGGNRIVIQLPGIDQETRHQAEDQILKVGHLEFRLVHKDNDDLTRKLWDNGWAPKGFTIEQIVDPRFNSSDNYFVAVKTQGAGLTSKELKSFRNPPPGYDFMMVSRMIAGRKTYRPYYVYRKPELTGEFLQSAYYEPGGMGEPILRLKFDKRGKKLLKNVTDAYRPGGKKNINGQVGRQLAIVLDDVCYSAPVIKTAIIDGAPVIEGIGSADEAKALSGVLQAGSLPAPVELIEKQQVDANLGQDAIDSGINAVIYGGIGVLLFMLIYYMLSGIIADIALALDLVLLPLGMVLAAGFLGIFASGAGGGEGGVTMPVLTLPGIAGILLTIGIAVDANVLIFERIREEFKLGKSLRAAIAAGYDRAFVTIVDANVTTLITAVILFIAGSGPVRGFAVTLSGGIIVSMFTALVVTRLMFDGIASKTKITKLPMLSIIGTTKINFVSMRSFAAVLSAAIIIGTWFSLVSGYREDVGKVLGVDFTGGSSVTFRVQNYEARPAVADVRDALKDAGLQEAHIQYKKTLDNSGISHLAIRAGVSPIGEDSASIVVRNTIIDTFGKDGISEGIEEVVGPQVGAELRERAMYAIIFALVGIVIYITWRFEFGFAVGAIAALAHDVFITLGVFYMCGRQVSLPIVAALLTIVGYSVNDTIVVFDRIRENLKDSGLRKKHTYKEICNLSLNQTLSRTLLTSATTLIAVGMLFVFGGGAINDFALALCVGVIAGTYSSIFVATPVMLFWHGDKKPAVKKSQSTA